MEQIGMQVAAAVATKALTSLFGGGESASSPPPPQAEVAAPAAPAEETPKTVDMPTASASAVAASKRRSISAQIARRGRASTILTDSNTEKLGS